MQVWTEAKEDCMWLVYYLCFIAPMHSLLVKYLESRGKRISSGQVMAWIAAFTLFSMFLPLVNTPHHFVYCSYVLRLSVDASSLKAPIDFWAYVSRYGDAYSWAQVYAALKQRYVDGKLSPEGWTQIDAAYDILYDPHVRRAHDGWGPDFQVQLQKDMLFNVALFYMLWAVGVFIATAGRKYQSGRDLAVAALLVVRYQKLAKTSIWECMWFVWQTLVFEVSVRFFSYDPRLTLLSQATPFELVMALHMYVDFFA
ncbi:hypothetical protein AaE_008084 [Aphanomyces astaci]|uniref:Uncharacterized protein n=1 Tax=Aphanomyces astaci TaxID=112090 RepID=A0A6A5ABS4_APHAT|nr:hypothetical protein AaE_008084 [Aphanomyces astaci]